jgi:hypothetical protein
MPDVDNIGIENFATPGRILMVERVKFLAMRDVLLSVLPAKAPRITSAEVKGRILHVLAQDLFPGTAKAGWWQKAAQLDLEAKGCILREDTKPLKFHLA